jgi:sugar/nucleoside kinase (ribokinase family)
MAIEGNSSRSSRTVVCAGIIALDQVFRVERLPRLGEKIATRGFFIVNGGCAANAAVAIARLGGRAALAGPLGGPAGADSYGDQILAALGPEGIDCRACVRVPGAATALSAILLDSRGERTIVTHRDPALDQALPVRPEELVRRADAVLVDNHFPDFVLPICKAARARGIPLVLDADRATHIGDILFRLATYVVFSSECLRATAGIDRLDMALEHIAKATGAFLAVTNGPDDVLWREKAELRRTPVLEIETVDTLGAGDVFHGAFALALAEGQDLAAAVRFGSAAASLKCMRLGGSMAAPFRSEIDAALTTQLPIVT